jgi:RimJ/RimL family protein N-acetyltransferase
LTPTVSENYFPNGLFPASAAIVEPPFDRPVPNREARVFLPMLYPHTESRRISLCPASASDAPAAYELLFRMGHGGLPTIDQFVSGFGRGMAAYFLVRLKETDELVGLATISEPNPAGHVRVEVNVRTDQPSGIVRDATALTTNFAFSMWRIRKVYFHVTRSGVESLAFGEEHTAMVREEAVLRDHVFFHGCTWDVTVLAIHREDWNVLGVDLLKQLV